MYSFPFYFEVPSTCCQSGLKYITANSLREAVERAVELACHLGTHIEYDETEKIYGFDIFSLKDMKND
jgi:hypothetical protein